MWLASTAIYHKRSGLGPWRLKAGTTTVLVAMDVAAHGLDIPEVKLVINVTVKIDWMLSKQQANKGSVAEWRDPAESLRA